jgi:type II restriction/modification system DNA methylase subunit YeeA
MLNQPTPTEKDSSASWFCFQKFGAKSDGRPGVADVYYRGRFGWEYKGNHKDLEGPNGAYAQLLQYRENLQNPPALIVSDFTHIVVRTNFTNSITKRYEIRLDDLISGRSLPGTPWTAIDLLRLCFEDPASLNPAITPASLTEGAAARFARLADDLRARRTAQYDPLTRAYPRLYTDEQVAKFLTRMVFCMFASDVGLLPGNIISKLIDQFGSTTSQRLAERFSELFRKMETGGDFGTDEIPFFNGGLFADDEALEISSEFVSQLRDADQLDWSEIEPSIFGTLFERILDPSRRRQIGAHYTSRADIEMIVKPVLMEPLEREWDQIAADLRGLNLMTGHADTSERRERTRVLAQAFIDRLATVRVLDPACGSGNFLYVSLSLLKELEQKVRSAAASWGVTSIEPRVHPRRLHGIEVDPYAHELASIVVWIGYLQWKRKNGVPFETESPILEPFTNFQRMDAIMDLSNPDTPQQATWPDVDVILGNPPFLGGRQLRRELGDDYVAQLHRLWSPSIKPGSDLCCYWFEKARVQLNQGRVKRVGLLATQGIRGGKNRDVLKAVKETGDIFFAVDDRKWMLDGAAVQVSMVGFDDGSEKRRVLVRHTGGRLTQELVVPDIHADLTANTADTTTALRLEENLHISFMGDVKAGKFELTASEADLMLRSPNPHGRPNSDVIRPWINATDVTDKHRHMWAIDFAPDSTVEEAALYEMPFATIKNRVKPERDRTRRLSYRERWWVHAEPCIAMRNRIWPLRRFLVTPGVSKHRLFVWIEPGVLPDHALMAFARDDDYFFGVLHSRPHELWALRMGTQLESRPRYTPTTSFETFPLPWLPGGEPADDPLVKAIAGAAKRLAELRQGWLHPSTGPANPLDGVNLSKRTLTNLYNERPQWLVNAHGELDQAVFNAYGWPHNLDDDEMLARLLALNHRRAETIHT